MSGKIHRRKKSSDFVTLDTHCSRNKNLRWASKGLHTYLFQLPDDWQINIADLENRSEDGRESTTSAMNALINAGYVVRERKHDDKGRFEGYDYFVFERPEHAIEWLTVNGKSVNGKSVNGLTVYGKTATSKVLSYSKKSNSKNEGRGNEAENTPSPPKDFDEMIKRVNAEVSTIEAEKEKISPVPAAPSFSGYDISDEADELKNGVVRRDGPNYEPTDFDFYSKVPLSDMLEDAPVMLVQSFDGQTLPGALVTTVEGLNLEQTTRETAATASILKATGREIVCETADDANDLITAWAERNMATIENWYNRSRRVISVVDLQNIITKFCGTYANHSDSGKRLRFLADPVLFFRNQCSGWLIDQNKYDREQAAKTNTGKFQQQDNAAAYVAPKAVRPVQTFYE